MAPNTPTSSPVEFDPSQSSPSASPAQALSNPSPTSTPTSHLDSPSFPTGFAEWAEANGVLVLGVCYGLQLLVQRLGGVVKVGEKQEYGRMEIKVEKDYGIFRSKKVGDKKVVWMSHGDEVAKLPEGFEVVARTSLDQWLQSRAQP